jgi:hypothetical protein
LSISSLRSGSMIKEIPLCWLSKQYVFLVKTPCSLDRNMVMIEIYENYIPRIVISSHVVLQPANARKPRLILVDMSPWQIRNALRCILGWGLETVPSARSQIGRGMSPEKDLGSCLPQKLAVPQSRKLGIQKNALQFLTKVEWVLHVFTTKWGGPARFQQIEMEHCENSPKYGHVIHPNSRSIGLFWRGFYWSCNPFYKCR